jgi:hypothetical protein
VIVSEGVGNEFVEFDTRTAPTIKPAKRNRLLVVQVRDARGHGPPSRGAARAVCVEIKKTPRTLRLFSARKTGL